MSWLKDRLQEVAAQVNMWDGGKTAATVRAARPAPRPAQTVSRPQGGFNIANNPLTRGAGRVYDQLNVFDNGRSWSNPTPTYQSSFATQFRDLFDANTAQDYENRMKRQMQANPQQQAIRQSYTEEQQALGRKSYTNPLESIIRANIVDPVARGVNTLSTAAVNTGEGLYGLGKIAKESAFGTDESYQQALNQTQKALDSGYGRGTGLLGVGTNIQNTQEMTDPLKFAGAVLETGSDIASVIPTGAAAKAGVTTTKLVSRPVLGNAVISGASAAASNVGQQVRETGTVNPMGVATSALLGTAMPVAGYGAGRVTTKLVTGGAGQAVSDTATRIKRAANPAAAQIDDSIATLEMRRANASPAEQVRIGKAIDELIRERTRINQGGYIRTPGDDPLEALRQVESGKADPAFMEYYNDMNLKRAGEPTAKVLETKAPKKPSEAEWASMLDQASKESKPTKNNLLKIRSEYNQQIASAVKAGDLETANKLRAEARTVGGQVKTMTKENMPKNASAVIDDDFKVKTPMNLKDKITKKKFETATKEYLGQSASRKIERDSKVLNLNSRFKLTNEEKLNAIISIDDSSVKPMNDKVAQYVDNYRKLTDEAYQDYTSNGVAMGFQSEYLPRIYKNPLTGEAIDGNTYRLLQAGSARQKGRSAELLNTDDLIYKDPTELLNSYYRSLDETVAGKQYLDTLEKEGILTKSTEPVRGLRPIVAEGMQSNDGMFYYAQKDVANKLNELFGGKEATNAVENLLEKGAGINSFVQSFVLSGGIPNTPINAFGIMQMTKEAMALHPIKAGKAFATGMNKSFAKKVFTQKKDILKLMAENDVAPRVDIQNISKTGTQRIKDRAGVTGKFNQAWNEFTNDATFGRMMPALEVMHFENVYKSALKKYDQKKAASIAAESVKNFYGRTSDYKQAVRAKMTDDFTGAVLFAPRFRESMLNFWGRNVKSLNPMNLGKKEFRDNQKFLVSAALMWAGMEALNMAMNGVWMHDNPDGKKDKLLIPDSVNPLDTGGKDVGIPFLSSIATVPRNTAAGAFNLATGRFTEAKKNAESFLSMPLNTVADVFSNEDYFGNPVIDDDATPAQKFTQAGAYIAKSNMQPWIREGLNVAGQNLPEDVKKSLGIKKKSTAETIANATESPFRFYDPKYYRYSDSWTPRGGKDEKFTIAEQRTRAGIKKDIDSIPDKLGLTNKQKEGYEALRAVDFDDEGNLVQDNDPFYRAKRATALQDDGVFRAMKRRAELEFKLNGKPVDPLFNLAPSERRLILWKQTLPAGTKDPSISEMYNQEWYQDFRADQDRYYTAKQAYNKKMGYSSGKKNDNPYPEPSKDLQAKLDVYYSLPKGTGQRSAMLRENPDILAHWDKTEAWTNGERAKVGLGELPQDDMPWSTLGRYASTGGSRRSGRGGGRGGKGRGSRGKSNKFDYKLDMFDSSNTKLSKRLRQLLKEAEVKSKA